jgi:hypothetical protein
MAYGLRPVNHGGYNYNTSGFEEFKIDDAYTTRISNGDMVTLIADEGVNRLGTAPTPGLLAGASTAVPANQALGIFVGCRYDDSNSQPTWSHFFPASGVTSGTAYAQVVTDPNAVFKIMGTGAWTDTYVGIVIDPTMTAGSGIDGNSGLFIPDYSSDAAGCLRIMGVIKNGENEVTSTTPDLLVRWSNPDVLWSGYQTALA